MTGKLITGEVVVEVGEAMMIGVGKAKGGNSIIDEI